jgi:hypothetical protein
MAIPPTDHGQDCPCVISRDVTPRPSRKVCAASTTDGLASRWKYIRQTTDSGLARSKNAAATPSGTSARKRNGDTPGRSDDHIYNRKMRGLHKRLVLGDEKARCEGQGGEASRQRCEPAPRIAHLCLRVTNRLRFDSRQANLPWNLSQLLAVVALPKFQTGTAMAASATSPIWRRRFSRSSEAGNAWGGRDQTR